jgi:transposase
MKRALSPLLTGDERSQLQVWTRSRLAQVRLAERARIILLAADGLGDKAIAAQLGCDRRTAARWRKRFIDGGIADIQRDAPRRPTRRLIPAEKIETVIRKTRAELPPNGRRWSSRAMARAVGTSEATIRRIWQARGIVPEAVDGNSRPGVTPGTTARPRAPVHAAIESCAISTTVIDATSPRDEHAWSGEERHEIC